MTCTICNKLPCACNQRLLTEEGYGEMAEENLKIANENLGIQREVAMGNQPDRVEVVDDIRRIKKIDYGKDANFVEFVLSEEEAIKRLASLFPKVEDIDDDPSGIIPPKKIRAVRGVVIERKRAEFVGGIDD